MLNPSPPLISGHAQHLGRILFTRPGVGTAIQVEQFATTHCYQLNSIEPQINLVKRGRKIVRNAAIELISEKGVATVFPAGFEADIVNEVDEDGCFQALSVMFPAEVVAAQSSVTPPLSQITSLGEIQSGFRDAMDYAVEAIYDPLLPSPIALHRMAELLVWLERQGIRLSFPSPNDLVTTVKRLFAGAPDAAWPAQDVTEQLGMSEATLRRRLARAGTSLSKLLLETRMLTALTLLQAGDQSILQIAYAVGYDSPSRFAGRFRQRFGFAPSELRKSNR